MTEQNKRIGDYEVLKTLGSGGMGRVYQVRNVITDRIEAMKVLLPDLEGHEDVAARFLREIKVLAALNHPNIASLHTAQTINNQLVMIMEYVEGQSLSSRLGQGAIPAADALSYMDQVLSALSYAHQHRVIHRDIKPANMMLTSSGQVKLMDFGIARTEDEPSKLTATGSTLGSMNYMSPEQVKGEKTDERSDLYSLGISFYEMVTGTKPFQGDSNFSIMAAHLNTAPTPPVDLDPNLPGVVNDIILTAIAKSPEQRFQNADSFRAAIQRAIQSLGDEKTFVQGSAIGAAATPATARTGPVTVPRQVSPSVPRTAAAVQPPPIPLQAQYAPLPASGQAAKTSGSRGLYMALGALVVVVVLVAAGLYLPNRKSASAAPGTNAPAQTVTNANPAPSTSMSSTPPQQVAEVTNQEPAQADAAPATETKTQTPAKKIAGGVATGAANVEHAAAEPAKPTVDEAALDTIEHDIDQLSARAGSVNSGLDNLQRQQQAAGYGLRGDMAAKQASMKLNLSKAQDAIQHNDAARAKRYAALANADIEALEKFLGR